MTNEKKGELRKFVDQNVIYGCTSLVTALAKDGGYPELKKLHPGSGSATKFEYWIVSAFLASKLEAEGEQVVEFLGLTIWGRSAGRPIELDDSIEYIYDRYV